MGKRHEIPSEETNDSTSIITDGIGYRSYKELLTVWDKQEYNMERSHRKKRDGRSFEVLEQPPPTAGRHKPQENANLRKWVNFENIIFSQNPDDLHELVSDGALSSAIKGLTARQKEILHYMAVIGYTTAETAKLLGISPRSVLNTYNTALHHIRGKIYPIIKLRRKLEKDERYRGYAKGRGIYTTKQERDFMDRADGKVKGYYGK